MTRTTHNPNRVLFLMTLVMMLLTTTQFSPRLLARERIAEERSLVIDCQHRHVSQRDAGWLMETDNSGQAYAKRAQLYANVARACKAGVTVVRVERAATIAPRPAQARR